MFLKMHYDSLSVTIYIFWADLKIRNFSCLYFLSLNLARAMGYRLYHSAGATTLCFILEQFKQFYRTLSKTETILGYGLLKALYLIIKLQRWHQISFAPCTKQLRMKELYVLDQAGLFKKVKACPLGLCWKHFFAESAPRLIQSLSFNVSGSVCCRLCHPPPQGASR